MKEETTVDWAAYAKAYAWLEQLTPYASAMDEVLAALAPSSTDRVFDAGGGVGALTYRILEVGATVTMCDGTAEMLAEAKVHTRAQDVRFQQADFNQPLLIPDKSFEKVACTSVLYVLKSPLHFLMELHRILTPGGRLVLMTPRQGYENGLILKEHCGSIRADAYWQDIHQSPERARALCAEAFKEQPGLMAAMLEIAKWNALISAEVSYTFFAAAELAALLRRAGFVVTSQKMTYANQSHLVVAEKV